MELSCHLSHLSVDLCVGLSVWKVYCGKMADWIWMLFGMMSGVSQGMVILDGVVISCVEVREPIELSFRVVSTE